MTTIRLEHITKVYRSGGADVRAVDDVSLSVESGEFFFLLGPSGCGKTTLLRVIAGLIEPDAGRLWFDDRDVTALPIERRHTAMVFQNYALWPHMTVGRNVEFGPRMRGLPAPKRRDVAMANLRRVQMEDYVARKPNQLSGGQQQRVALARALAAGGDCLLLDEPLSNLDARLRLAMRDQLRQLVQQAGSTAIYVTHDQKEALSMADRVAVMNAGRIVQIGRPQEIYDRPQDRFVADFLGEANFIPGTVQQTGSIATTVATPAGVLLGAAGASAGRPLLSVGQAVTCCVRPERIAVQPPGQAPSEPSVAATIESSTYLGELRQYRCRLGGGATWKVTVLSGQDPPLAPGTKVALAIRAPDLTLLTS
jgi:iron(III) transport system ATP-binding protein